MLLQAGKLFPGFDQDRHVRIGVLPESKEVAIGRTGFLAIRRVFCSLKRIGAGDSQTCERGPGKIHYQPTMIDELLKLRGGCGTVVQHQVSFSAHVGRA